MIFLGFMELMLGLALLVLISTQIVWPAMTGGKSFPLLRRKDLEHQRREAEEALKRAQEEQEINEIRHAVDAIAAEKAHTGHGDTE